METRRLEIAIRLVGILLGAGLILLCLALLRPHHWHQWSGIAVGAVVMIASINMRVMLAISWGVDWFNEHLGKVCDWLVLLACVVSAANAMVRYAYDSSSNAWLEIQWYMFAVIIMFGAAYTLKKNEHVRVDIVYMVLSERQQIWVDIIGIVLFLMPACVLLAWLSWPFFWQSYAVGEHSSNAGGLLRWPIKLVMPVGFALLGLQGISELVKRIAALEGLRVADLEAKYERPVQ